jgi:type I restriction enzyme M protein
MNLQMVKARIETLTRTLREARVHEEAVNACCATLIFLKRLTDVSQQPRAAHSFIPAEHPDLAGTLRGLTWSKLGKSADPGEEIRNLLRIVETSVPALEGLSLFNSLVYTFSKHSDQPRNIETVISALEAVSLVTITDHEMARLYQETLEKAADSAASAATPPSIRQLIARLFASESAQDVYDPAGGTASLLCEVGEKIRASGTSIKLYSQEITVDLVNLARIRAFLSHWEFDFRTGDTLMRPEHGQKRFDLIVSHPPFGIKIDAGTMAGDLFSNFQFDRAISSETAFLHLVASKLSDSGRAAILVPTGVLFRGGADHALRTDLATSGMLEAVLGLPAHLFEGTSISAAILVLRGRETAKRDERILIADLSSSIEGQKTRPRLSEAGIEAAIRSVNAKESIPGFSILIGLRDVAENDFNLSVSRYVRLSSAKAPSLETNLLQFEKARQLREEAEQKALTLVHLLNDDEKGPS